MPILTETNIGKLVEDLQRFYAPDREICGRATPQQISILLDRLEAYTNEVRAAADKEGLDDDDNVAQWATDMANWQLRLAHYRKIINSLPSASWADKAGCVLAWRLVTAPLLYGIWYDVQPGIGLSSDSKARIASGEGHPTIDIVVTVAGKEHPGGHSDAMVPDVILPFTLGNQVLVYKEHQEERARLFWEDLKQSAKDFVANVKKAAKWTTWIAVAAAGVVAVGGVVWFVRRMKSGEPRTRTKPTPISKRAAAQLDEDAIDANPPEPTPRQLARSRMSRLDY